MCTKSVVYEIFPMACSLLDYARRCASDPYFVDALFAGTGPLSGIKSYCEEALVVPEVVANEGVKSRQDSSSKTGGAKAFSSSTSSALHLIKHFTSKEQHNNAGLKIKNVLNRFITTSIRSNPHYRDRNVLILGYRSRSDLSTAGMRGNIDIECEFANTMHSFICNRTWQLLIDYLGEAFVLHVFLKPVFVPSSNGCYVQVAGIPIFQMAHKMNNANWMNHSRTFFFNRKDTNKEVKSLKRKVTASDVNKGTSTTHNSNDTTGTLNITNFNSNTNISDKSNAYSSLRALLTKKIVYFVQGSTQLPRFDIFYKHTYQERMAKFSKNSCAHSAACLLQEAFGLLPSNILNSNHDRINSPLIFHDINENMHPPERQLDGVMAMKQQLLLMFEAVARNYRKVSIRQTFIDFCSSTDNKGSDGQDNADNTAPWKRTRRGARAGVRERKRKERHTVRNRDEKRLENDNKNESAIGPLPSPKVSGSAVLRDGNVIPVGFKLFKQQLRNIRGSGIGNEDYMSQDNLVDSNNIPSLSTGSVVTGSNNANANSNDTEGVMYTVSNTWQQQSINMPPQTHSSSNEFIYNIDSSSASQEFNENVPMQQSTILENKLADTTKKATSYISAKGDGASSLSDSVPSINTECGIRRNFDRAMPTLASLTPSTGISRDHGVPSTNVDIVGTTKRNNIIHNSNGKGFAMKRRMTSLSAFDSDQESVAKPAKNYFDKCVSTDDVSSFIKSVCRRTFSNEDVWGSRHNMDAFLSNIDSYIRLGRNDTLTIEQIMKKIRITDIPWLQDHAIAAKRTRHGIFTAKVKMILLRTFFYWIICDFVNPLISMHFYVTEGEGMGSIVLFYSRSVWNQMVMDGFKQIKGQFVKMADYSISQHTAIKQNFNEDLMNRLIPTQDILRNIEPASTRFMPKKSSLRLITNMGNKKKTNGSTGSNTKNSNISSSYHTTNNLNSTSANSAAVSNSGLYNCLHVLKHTHQMNPSLSGFGVFGIDEIYKRLLHFRQRVQFDGTQPLYVAVLDLEKCYDNVDTGQLYDLVCTLLDTKGSTENDLFYAPDVYPKADGNDNDSDEEEDCILHKYHITHRINSMERVITKTVRHVSCEGEMFTFDEASGEIAGCYRNSIITDTVQYPRLSKEDILKTIRGHLFNHVVKIPDITSSTNNMATTKAISAGNAKKACDHYTQVKGIPQGSVLSPLLCNLYYGNAERKVFGSKDEIQILGIRDKSLIMRMMDDYIMISLDKDAVTHFLQRAHQSLKPYGGGVNYLKTRVNFDTAIEIEGARLRLQKIDSTRMPWCGFFVDTVTMEVTPSFDRVMGNHLRCSTSIDCSHIGFALRRVMKTFVRMKCHAIVLDSVLNLYNTVFKTVYEIFLVAAIRTHAFILNSKYFRAYNNTNHLFQCIIEAVLFGARLIHSRTAMKKSRRLNLGQDDQKTAQGSLLGHQVNTYKVLVTSSSDNNNMSDTMIKNAKNGSDVQSEQVSGASGCEIPYIQAQWLGYRAFESAFNVKRSLYAPILVQLKKKGDALKHTIETETPFNQENERTLQESNVTLLKDIY